jgi:hypothetical protein
MAGHDADSGRILAARIRAAAARLMLAGLLAVSSAAAAFAFQGASGLSEPNYRGAPLVRAGLCPQGEPCKVHQEPSYEPHKGRPRDWRPAAHGVAYETEPPTVYIEEECAEERPRARRYVAHPPPVYEGPGWHEYCGIRCWYRRLREGYCGRGCEYYFFRLTEFPEGKLSRYRQRRAACKTGH